MNIENAQNNIHVNYSLENRDDFELMKQEIGVYKELIQQRDTEIENLKSRL